MVSKKLSCIFLASGHSKRFHGNKLLAPLEGRPLVQHVFEHLPAHMFHQVLVVTRYPQVAQLAQALRFTPILNPDPTDDIAVTIRLGLEHLEQDMGGCMFSVCDQPFLSPASLTALVQEFQAHPHSIAALAHQGKRGNPVIFPSALFSELSTLAPHQSGSAVIARYPELLRLVEAGDFSQLQDIDYRSDLPLG